MVTTLTLQVKVVEPCQTFYFSANFLPGEVWLLPAGFWATDIWKLAVLQNEKNPEFDALEIMAANMNEHKTFSGVISFEEMNFYKSTNENNSANNSTFSEDEEKEANI